MVRLALFGDEVEAGNWARVASRIVDVRAKTITTIDQVNDDEVDAVVVCSVAGREDACRAAAGLGKDVFLVVRPDSAGAAIALNNDFLGDVRLMVGSDRYHPSIQTIKQSIDAGQLGTPGLIRVHRWQASAAVDPTSNIDLAIWMFGQEPNKVYAVGKPGDAECRDYIQVHLGFPGGGMGIIDVANSAAADYFSLSLIGSAGAAYVDDHHNQHLLFCDDAATSLKASEGDAARLAELQEFVNAINEQRQPSCIGADAGSALQIRDLAFASAHGGQPATWVG